MLILIRQASPQSVQELTMIDWLIEIPCALPQIEAGNVIIHARKRCVVCVIFAWVPENSSWPWNLTSMGRSLTQPLCISKVRDTALLEEDAIPFIFQSLHSPLTTQLTFKHASGKSELEFHNRVRTIPTQCSYPSSIRHLHSSRNPWNKWTDPLGMPKIVHDLRKRYLKLYEKMSLINE